MGNKAKTNFNDADLDTLLATVDESLAKADQAAQAALAKSKPAPAGAPLKKDDKPGDKDDDKPADAAPADAAPDAGAAPAPAGDPASAPADAGAAPAADAPPADGAPADGAPAAGAPDQAAAGDGAIQGEAQGDEQPLSDQELDQIYGSMPPQELERHYMAIRNHLQAAYAKAEADSKHGEGCKCPKCAPSMDKSEKDAQIAALEKKIEEQGKHIKAVVDTLERVWVPSRKSVANQFEIVQKTEGDGTKPTDEVSQLSKAEKTELLKRVDPGTLSKEQRNMVNEFILYDEKKYEGEIDKIISRGKK